MYTKPTDTHKHLHATSCDPSIYKQSIPYGQAIRLKRIFSDKDDLETKLSNLEDWLSNRGYKKEDIRPEIQRVHSVDRNDLLTKRKKNTVDTITLILTFHPAIYQVFEILKTAHRHITKSVILNKVLSKPPRVAFRNPKTLQDKLVRSKLKVANVQNESIKTHLF